MRALVQRSGLLGLAIVVLCVPAPARADALSYDLTVADAPTSGVSSSTANGLTTFWSTGPAAATLSAAEVNAELAAGRDVRIIDYGDYWQGGTLRIAAPLSGAGRSVSLRAADGWIDIPAAVSARELTLDASYSVEGDGGLTTDVTHVHAGGVIMLDGDNRLGRIDVRQERTGDWVRVRDAGPLTLEQSRAAGELTVAAGGGLELAGDLVTGGSTFLEGDADSPARAGDGDFTTTPGVKIDAGGHAVVIRSAHRVAGRLGPGLTINGQPYVPGTAFVSSDRERWGRQQGIGERDAVPFRFDFKEGDFVKPTARLDFGIAGPYFRLGDVVPFTYACDDAGGSGLASCTTNQRPDGTLDTTKLGHAVATVIATDTAGNTFTTGVPYFVSPPRKPCVAPTSVTLVIERPTGTRSVVATLDGRRQPVKVTAAGITITADVHGRAPGRYALKVTIRRGHGRKTVVRRPEAVVFKCLRGRAGER